jgi:hypothetical protein
MRFIHLYIWMALSAVGLNASAQVRALSEAESTAHQYMTAFFRGDIRTAAALTHPDTLSRLKKSVLAQEKETARGVANLDPQEFYVAVVQADRKRDMRSAEAMKDASVVVVSSQVLPDGGVVVKLRVTTPTLASTMTQESGLTLQLSGRAWKVVGNAQ